MNEILESAMKKANAYIDFKNSELAELGQKLTDCDNQLAKLRDDLKKAESFEEYETIKKAISDKHAYREELIRISRQKHVTSDEERRMYERLYGEILFGIDEVSEVCARELEEEAGKYIKLFEDALADQEKAIEVLAKLNVAFDIPCINDLVGIRWKESLYEIYTGYKNLLKQRDRGHIA